jgi:transaldolase
LWASTGTKDPAYSDVLYVERLIAPGVVNTMPEKTLHAFADHGNVERALDTDLSDAERTLDQAQQMGVNLQEITAALEREGVESFCDSYDELLACIEAKLKNVAAARASQLR